MNKAPADILRDVADLALRRGLNGRAFPAAVDATRHAQRRDDVPPQVRELAALIRFRGAHLSAAGVACVLRARAMQVDRERQQPHPPLPGRKVPPGIVWQMPQQWPRLSLNGIER